MIRAIILIIFFLLSNLAFACPDGVDSLVELVESPKTEISGPFSVEELEQDNMIKIRGANETLSFGYAHKQWLAFKAGIVNSDRIYFMKLREKRFYMDGHILIRNGCVTKFLAGAIS